MNRFEKLVFEALGITEEESSAIANIMKNYNIEPCVLRDVLQPACRGEKVGKSLLAIMQFKADEKEKQVEESLESLF